MSICEACGAENRPGRKFCAACGRPLGIRCAACGSENEAGERFCGECGAQLGGADAEPPLETRIAERRLVSVLFVDLVGFTAASEGRDAEETRELLSRYFERARTLISRYGGTVEKFIGDAVMAVWGAPVANEDDAERAVRAALDLVGVVGELDPELRARVGILTGEAAVTVGAEGQGMVAGDLVNTASRIQSVADAGSVLVGESTKQATEAAITYEDAGLHELKGKTEPVQLYRALRVMGGRAGALRSAGLEPPFVGRERELRLVKELFHATSDERRAQLVSVVGIAGIGKTRLSWEFEKYQDGLAEAAWWHRGRCLSYGEGVAYWALAEMVRMRCLITEDEPTPSAREKLHLTLGEYLADDAERAWVEPRLAHLLGLEEGIAGDQENLFSAWRVLFERLAEQDPVVLVFEDMQWADSGLLDFLEYLLDWSRNHPIFVLSLARPELADRHPNWGVGKRAVTSLYLEPLPSAAMEDLLTGLVPGLPHELRTQILGRAEGVPLYAVETVRMLLDRGLLVQEGNVFRPAGAIDTLDVPQTLHQLVAARLDGLTVDERNIVQTAAVLGKTFTREGVARLAGLDVSDVDQQLASLLRKEVLAIQADPRSPERGQYSFLQDIVRHVAYEMLSRRDRKELHLAAAEYLASIWEAEDDEIAEVRAAHYLDAYAAAPDAEDAPAIRGNARDLLTRAGDRAASLGATAEAQRAYERALELVEDDLARATFHERAGTMASIGARVDEAAPHFERAVALFEQAGATHPAARVSAKLAEIVWDRGRLEEGLDSMSRAFDVLTGEEPDEDIAALAAQLGRFSFFAGDRERALVRIEHALDISEALLLPEVLSQALNTKALILNALGRHQEALVLLAYALDTALEHEKPSAALRAYYNLAELQSQLDRYEDGAASCADGLTFSRRVGSRYWEYSFLGQLYPFFALGRWAEAIEMIGQLPEDRWTELRNPFLGALGVGTSINVHRGNLAEAERMADVLADFATSADIQERASFNWASARIALARGDAARALELAETALGTQQMGFRIEFAKESFVLAIDAAFELGDLGRVDDLLGWAESLPLGRRPQFVRAHSARFRGRLAAARGEPDEAERGLKGGAGLFRELALPFYLAVTNLELGEWLAEQKRSEEAAALVAEATATFERLEAKPWLERAAAIEPTEIEV